MRVLITGATGLIGSKITELCREKGIGVNYLTTSKDKIEKREDYRGYYWNPVSGEIDEKCFEGVGTIINLAGENVFQPWTQKNKESILNSRLSSLNLLHNGLKKVPNNVGQVISASAIGIYPSSFQKMYYEDEQKVDDTFLGEVVKQWESAADELRDLNLRIAKIRIGLVLSNEGGMLPQMEKPLKFNMGTSLGSGKQWQSWIHIHDLARIFLFVMDHGLTGVYNAVAPNPVTNKDLVEQLAKAMGKHVWLPRVPALALKLTMGEMSSMILGSQLVSSKKIEEAGFEFHFVNLEKAFEDLWQKKTG